MSLIHFIPQLWRNHELNVFLLHFMLGIWQHLIKDVQLGVRQRLRSSSLYFILLILYVVMCILYVVVQVFYHMSWFVFYMQFYTNYFYNSSIHVGTAAPEEICKQILFSSWQLISVRIRVYLNISSWIINFTQFRHFSIYEAILSWFSLYIL